MRRINPALPVANAASKPTDLRYLRLRHVCERVGVGATTIYKMMATGAFPRQVKLSVRTAAWIESELEAFMNVRIAERDQPAPTPEVSRYLRMGEVMRLRGMTHAMIYDGVRAKTFPQWADLPKRGSSWPISRPGSRPASIRHQSNTETGKDQYRRCRAMAKRRSPEGSDNRQGGTVTRRFDVNAATPYSALCTMRGESNRGLHIQPPF
jgi:prophage regulatory protein